MTVTLRLLPISRYECRTRLKQKGIVASLDDLGGWSYSSRLLVDELAQEFARPRHPITLKLCSNGEDIIAIDDDDGERTNLAVEYEVIKYESQYQDGSMATIASLGRNITTGIKCTAVSRALCDVSISKKKDSSSSRSGAGKEETFMVDLAASSPEPKYADMAMAPRSSSSETEGKHNGNGDVKDAAITAADASLCMRKPAGKHGVHLDGVWVNAPLGRHVPLNSGSVIALYGPTGFAYEVILDAI